jgi:hypothetical protein
MRVAPPIALTSEQREALEQCARARSLSVRLFRPAAIRPEAAYWAWQQNANSNPRAARSAMGAS